MNRQIHAVARHLGISRRTIATSQGLEAGYGGRRCLLCKEFGLTDGLRFNDPSTRIPTDRIKISQGFFRSLEVSTVDDGRQERDPTPAGRFRGREAKANFSKNRGVSMDVKDPQRRYLVQLWDASFGVIRRRLMENDGGGGVESSRVD